ncbi:MAG: spondin domain-containing protein [Prevotella sp.]|jgi:hypothetical protein|nr:spondin domain-containing protein [Prevotella sp.]
MMKKKFLKFAVVAAILFSATWITSCSDDDDDDDGDDSTGIISFENVLETKDFVQSGTFNMSGSEAAILPGQSVSFTFNAGRGQRLAFATMYGYSNDLFFAPENPGLDLYTAGGEPLTGDRSLDIKLWDNGTRVNQQPSAENTHPGIAQSADVTRVEGEDAQGNIYLDASELMKLNLTYNKTRSEFTLTITNNTSGTINETPFSPGVWAVSNIWDNYLENNAPFFVEGQMSSTQMTALAETGDNEPLYDMVEPMTGILTGISPVVVVVYTGDVNPLYELNKEDTKIGLSELAQRGSTSPLVESLREMSNVRSIYIAGTQVTGPTEKVEVGFNAVRGDKIAFATMFTSSNDWFYSNSSDIDALSKGDITSKVALLDDGTAVNQYPGAGNLQAAFGGISEPEDKVIVAVDDTYPVPAVSSVLKVVIR